MAFFQRRKNEIIKALRAFLSILAGFEQRRLAKAMELGKYEELVVFFVPTVYECNGGVMSIDSLATITQKLKPEAMVLTATMPGNPTLVRNRFFPNKRPVLTLKIISKLCQPKKVVVHLPEMLAQDFVQHLSYREYIWFKNIEDISISILNYDDAPMAPLECYQNLQFLTGKITQSDVHMAAISGEGL